jgi:hypothetical protein
MRAQFQCRHCTVSDGTARDHELVNNLEGVVLLKRLRKTTKIHSCENRYVRKYSALVPSEFTSRQFGVKIQQEVNEECGREINRSEKEE